MKAYHDLLQTILDSGNDRGDRTGTGTRSCFGLQFRHNLQEGFPLLTTKKLSFKNIAIELLWFLRGDTNIKYLLEDGCHIWTADAYRMYCRKVKEQDQVSAQDFEHGILNNPDFCRAHGDLGPVYGKQWRHWDGKPQYKADNRSFTSAIHDQIRNLIAGIRKNPEGRRHIVTAWNPAEVDNMALPPCHCLFQCYVHDNKLSTHLYQRSADYFLGVPYNIASYALLTHILAHQTGLGVGELIISFGDIHVYNNHKEQIAEQLTREPRSLPRLIIKNGSTEIPSIDGYEWLDFSIREYDPYPTIKGDLSVGT